MLRFHRFLCVPLLLFTCASLAQAEELGLLVERTALSTEAAHVVLLSDKKGPVTLRAWRIGETESLAKLRKRNDLGQPVTESTVQYTDVGKRQGFKLSLPAPGFYLLEAARSKSLRTRATLLVSDLALVTKRHPAGLLVWAVHRDTGLPWPGVEIRAGTAGGVSDTQGLWQATRALPPTVKMSARVGPHLAFGEETWFSPQVNDRRVHVFAHQPAYRPGERVEVKGVVRAYVNGQHRLDPTVRRVELRLHDPSGEVAVSHVVPVRTDLGTFDGGFDLLKSARTGAWMVVVVIDGDEYEAPVRVEAYRKPAFEVTVLAKDARILAGGQTRFDLSASYYDGGPVAGAQVSWQLIHHRVDRELFPSDELLALFFGSERTAYEPQTLSTGSGKLDSQGHLLIPVQAPAQALDGWLSLRAVVVGRDSIAVAGSGGIAVAAAPLRIALETDKHLYGLEDVVGVTVRIEGADGRPAADRAGELVLSEDVTIWGEPQAARPAPRATRHPFQTDAQGEAHLEISLPREGLFRLHASVPLSKPAGRLTVVEAEVLVWAAADQPTIGLAPTRLEVVVDRDHFAVGDTARLLVRTPGNLPVLATLEGATLHGAEVLSPKNGGAVWSVKLEPEHAPNVFATFVLMDRGSLRVETRMLRIPPVSALLHVDIEADNETLEPGATTGLTIRVKDAEDKPVANAEIALAIVDDALHGLHADPAASLASFFHPMRRNAVSTGGLLHHDSVGFARFTPPAKKKAPRPSTGGGGGGRYRGPSGGVPPGVREPTDGRPNSTPSTPVPQPSPEPEAAPELPEEEIEEDAELGFAGDGDNDDGDSGDEEGTSGLRLLKERKSNRRAPPKARKDFRTCVFWAPALRTNEAGLIRVEGIRFAESLTRWRIGLRAVDAETRVGSATLKVRTRKNVSVRLTTPRFLIATDRAEVPLLLRNLTPQRIEATWHAEAREPGLTTEEEGPLQLAAGATDVRTLEVAAQGAGELVIRASLRSLAGSDAEERRVPIYPQGIERVTGHAVLSEDSRLETLIVVPKNAVAGTIRCRISVEPSTVSAVAGALPYLADYPHGCTEQTLSRFLPVVAALDAADQLKVPVIGRLAELPAMAEAGLQRLAVLRHADGGFGWWPSDDSSPEMTALVLRGLNRVAARLPKNSPAHRLRKDATMWLLESLQSTVRLPADAATRASVRLALAGAKALPKGALAGAIGVRSSRRPEPLVMALNLQAATLSGEIAVSRTLLHQLEALAREGDGSVHWALSHPGGSQEAPTSWREDPIQTTAEVAYALLKAGGDPALLAGAARWLVLNRPGGSHWRSTRDTAAAVRFLAAHAASSGDLGIGTVIEAKLNGEPFGQVQLTRETLFSEASLLTIPAERLIPGRMLSLSLATGKGSFSAGVNLGFFETGPAIAAGSHGLTVKRRWFVLEAVEGKERVTWTRTPLTETVSSGTLIECEIEVTSPKPYDYIQITDLHAAGFEPVREVGMAVPGREEATPAEREGYDDRTLFFVTHLPAGRALFRHTVRATHQGTFTALPAQAELMYFPEVRGNSAGELLEITPAGPAGTKKGGAK